jgi:hypothetical protein
MEEHDQGKELTELRDKKSGLRLCLNAIFINKEDLHSYF